MPERIDPSRRATRLPWWSAHLMVLVLFLSLNASCSKDTPEFAGGVHGIVSDAQTNRPLAGALVELTPNHRSMSTGADGNYTFDNLYEETYTVQVRKDGYISDSRAIKVSPGVQSQQDFALQPDAPVLSVAPTSLDFGTSATSLTLNVQNVGEGLLSWQIAEDIPWLTCNPTSGTNTKTGQTTVAVTVSRESLEPGAYAQTIAVTSDGGSAVVQVSLLVQGIAVSVAPEALDFGATTTSLSLTLTNLGSGSISYTLLPSNGWIIPQRTSGTFSQNETIVIGANREGLAAGDYNGMLTLAVGDQHKDIPVRMTVSQQALPVVTLYGIDGVTFSSATFHGGVAAIGSSRVVRHGFCWSTAEAPTLDDGTTSSCNFGDCDAAKDMTYLASNLEGETAYYVRAYAQNSEGTAYSTPARFVTTPTPQRPTVETGAVQQVTSSSAICAGNLLSLGTDVGVTEYGHVWDTRENPTVGNLGTKLGASTAAGAYASSLTGLQPNTAYHVRAYATNAIGTSYGDDVLFTTQVAPIQIETGDVSDITHEAATVTGKIVELGGNTLRACGVCWSTRPNPTLSDGHAETVVSSNVFSIRLSGLTEKTTYYARAYATSAQNDETYYGQDIRFTTTHIIYPPTLSGAEVSDIGIRQAAVQASVMSDGEGTLTDCGFVYATHAVPTAADRRISLGTPSSPFSATLSDLDEYTRYYVRAYAVNEAGMAYGDAVSFTTLLAPIQVETGGVSDITHDAAMASGRIVELGGNSIGACGICWGTSPDPTLADSHAEAVNATSFSVRLTGLAERTAYYARAYATSAEDGRTYYGASVPFTTTHVIHLPTLSAPEVSAITAHQAAVAASLLSDGEGTISDCGFVYARHDAPTTDDRRASLGTQTGRFSMSLSGLDDGTQYYVRAYAVNEAGTAYGAALPFSTLQVLPPSLSEVSVGQVTHRAATFTASVTDTNNGPLTDAGFVYGTAHAPTLADGKISAGAVEDFSARPTALQPSTTYYVRAYAVNEKGTAYGAEASFTTAEEPQGSDVGLGDYGSDEPW